MFDKDRWTHNVASQAVCSSGGSPHVLSQARHTREGRIHV